MSLKLPFFLISFLIRISLQNNHTILESDLNKAITCNYIISKKYDLTHEKLNQKLYSSSILSCFILISEKEAKNFLLSIQNGDNSLKSFDIERLIDINIINTLEKSKILEESQKLEIALNEFNNIGNKNKNKEIKVDEEYGKVHKWKDYKLTKFILVTTKILKFMNSIGKYIVIGVCIFFLVFLLKMIDQKTYVNRKKFKRS